MAESKSRIALEEFQDLLEAISGGSYFYAPNKVHIAIFSDLCLDVSFTTIYVIEPAGGRQGAAIGKGTFRDTFAERRVTLWCAKKINSDSNNPQVAVAADDDRLLVQDRLRKDVEAAFAANFQLDGAAINAEIVEWDDSPDSTYVEGWALLKLGVVITHNYTRTTP